MNNAKVVLVLYLVKKKFQILSVTADKGSKIILADQAFNKFSIFNILHFNLPSIKQVITVKEMSKQSMDAIHEKPVRLEKKKESRHYHYWVILMHRLMIIPLLTVVRQTQSTAGNTKNTFQSILVERHLWKGDWGGGGQSASKLHVLFFLIFVN